MQAKKETALGAMLAPLAKVTPYSPLDQDLLRFSWLSDEEAARELTDALYELPELRRAVVAHFLDRLLHAVLDGGTWLWTE